MVIPASMNQIHGGAQLIRLVLTSISALMIKTLQKALAQPDVFSRLGGPLPGPSTGHTQLWDVGALVKLVGNSLVPSSAGPAPHGPPAASKIFPGFAKNTLPRIPAGGGRAGAESSRGCCGRFGCAGNPDSLLAMNN